MPEEVGLFHRNVLQRARLSALRKILAYSASTSKEISIQLARKLRDLLSIQNRQISVENIQKTVADYYKIKVADMYSKKRPASIYGPANCDVPGQELTRRVCRKLSCLVGATTPRCCMVRNGSGRQQMTGSISNCMCLNRP
jgi:chromosomal replication initiator protein